MIKRRFDLLQKLAIFGGVTDEVLNLILNDSDCVKKSTGELFFRENDHPDGMYVLESGKVDIFKNWQEEEYHLSQLASGDCFSEMALVDMNFRSASIRAIEECQAIHVPTHTFTGIASFDLEQFALIQMNMGREICRRLRQAAAALFEQMVKVNEHYIV